MGSLYWQETSLYYDGLMDNTSGSLQGRPDHRQERLILINSLRPSDAMWR